MTSFFSRSFVLLGSIIFLHIDYFIQSIVNIALKKSALLK
ncbi:hypothetical protein Q757_02615 [Oenococcus alcoholitolerans]|uniref:Uncharacterized protein n=1 Tax=Oenococcus alcoholitolerans TaxID=931074 RepID=A0ABR4XRQ0_9LACO|nr:hypothetical protein Q757_02615 [Oenococcus alcoholitolerans]